MGILQDTQAILDSAREKSESILVAFSCGKDSITVNELCRRTFAKAIPFFMEFLPGLEVVEAELESWERKLNTKIIRVPHWMLSRKLHNGVYCRERPDIEEWSLDEVYQMVMADTGINLIATGAKKSDSMWRRRMLNTWGSKDYLVYPIQNWNKLDVLHFLKANRIPLPESSGKSATGIDLSTPSVLWLYDSHRKDYERIRKVFPFVDAIVARRKFYGIGADHFGNEKKKAG